MNELNTVNDDVSLYIYAFFGCPMFWSTFQTSVICAINYCLNLWSTYTVLTTNHSVEHEHSIIMYHNNYICNNNEVRFTMNEYTHINRTTYDPSYTSHIIRPSYDMVPCQYPLVKTHDEESFELIVTRGIPRIRDLVNMFISTMKRICIIMKTSLYIYIGWITMPMPMSSCINKTISCMRNMVTEMENIHIHIYVRPLFHAFVSGLLSISLSMLLRTCTAAFYPCMCLSVITIYACSYIPHSIDTICLLSGFISSYGCLYGRVADVVKKGVRFNKNRMHSW
jgi:hypothetical protein